MAATQSVDTAAFIVASARRSDETHRLTSPREYQGCCSIRKCYTGPAVWRPGHPVHHSEHDGQLRFKLMKSSLVFHIGLEKTGTTSFQQFCADRTDILHSLGIHYPKHGYLFHGNNHSVFTASYLSDESREFIPHGDLVSRDIAVSRLINDMKCGGYDKILISSEHLSSRFSETEIAQLAFDFAHYKPTIIVAVREHHSMIRAAYSTSTLWGSRVTLAEFIEMLWGQKGVQSPDRDVYFRYCRYRLMIEPWEKHFGKHNVRIIKYESNNGFIQTIISEVFGKTVSLPDTLQYNLNRTMPPYLVEYIRQYNMITPTYEELRETGALNLWSYVCEKRANFIALIAERAWLEIRGPSLFINNHCLEIIEKLVKEDKLWLAERGIDFSHESSTEAFLDNNPAKIVTKRRPSSPSFDDYCSVLNDMFPSNQQYPIIIHTLQQAAEDLLEARNRVRDLEREAHEISRSTSWRITLPVRLLGQLIKRFRSQSKLPKNVSPDILRHDTEIGGVYPGSAQASEGRQSTRVESGLKLWELWHRYCRAPAK